MALKNLEDQESSVRAPRGSDPHPLACGFVKGFQDNCIFCAAGLLFVTATSSAEERIVRWSILTTF
jgi:hypothetical protein